MHYRHYDRMKFFVGKLLHSIPILLFEETFYSIKGENFQEQAHESKYIFSFSYFRVFKIKSVFSECRVESVRENYWLSRIYTSDFRVRQVVCRDTFRLCLLPRPVS
jgi:hypothetical protein